MAVFGIQLALSMIMASVISKLGGKFSLARYLLCNTGLIRYLHPTDEELRGLAGVPKDFTGGKGKGTKGKGGKSKEDYKNPNSFHVPKNLDLSLETVKVTQAEVMHLRFYAEYHWALDYTVYATIVYIATEIYYSFVDAPNEMNLSVYWCLITLGLCISVLSSVTAMYFRGDDVMGERAMCMVMGLTYLLVAMMVLIVDEKTLEVGIDPAYKSFHDHASAFLQAQGLPSSGPASKLIIKFIIALMSAFTGALFTFPGIRMSKMFYDSLRYCEGRPFIKLLLNVAFVFPLINVVLWVRPIGRDLLTKPFGASGQPLMSEAIFESVRIGLVVAMVVLRVVLMPFFLQSFLNIAQDRITELQKEAGRIINIDLQKKVAGIYYYLGIVAVQYVTPMLICLHCCFMYKTLGNGSWTGSSTAGDADNNGTSPAFSSVFPDGDDTSPAAEHFAVALSSLRIVFNPTVFRGIFGFATWWCTFLLFASSAVGAAYQSYLSHA